MFITIASEDAVRCREAIVAAFPRWLPPEAALQAAQEVVKGSPLEDKPVCEVTDGDSKSADAGLSDLMQYWHTKHGKDGAVAYLRSIRVEGGYPSLPADLTREQWMLIGCAIGDAFGAGVEFEDSAWVRENVDGSKWVSRRDSVNYVPGMYTDDTEMTAGVVKALIHRTGDEDKVGVLLECWKDEYLRETHHVLSATLRRVGVGRDGHGGIARVYSKKMTVRELQDNNRTKDLPGNAPTMRACPFGFLERDEMKAWALANAETTHPHPKAKASSLVVAWLVSRGLSGAGFGEGVVRDAIAYLQKEFPEVATIEYLKTVDALPPSAPAYLHLDVLCGPQPITGPKQRKLHGLNSDAMRTAGTVLHVLRHHRDPLSTLLECVWVGGDTDSVASVALGVLGAAGELPGNLPRYLLEETEALPYLAHLGQQFHDSLHGHKRTKKETPQQSA